MELTTETMTAIVTAAVTAFVAAMWKQWLDYMAWKKLQKKAIAEVKNPESPISDPREAMEKVLIEDNHKRLRQASGLIKLELSADSDKPSTGTHNGSNGTGGKPS